MGLSCEAEAWGRPDDSTLTVRVARMRQGDSEALKAS
jgi:hypothetical protein